LDFAALRLSLELAALTTLALLALGLPLAAWLARSRLRLKFLVEAVVALPLVLPPTVLGFYLLLAFAPRSPLGQAWERVTGRRLAFSFDGLLIASILYSLPFAVQPFAAAISAVDHRLEEASRTLGASRLATFLRVTLPLSIRGVVAGAVLTFAHTLGEFGVVLMVGGNLQGETRTLSIAIFDHVEALEYAAAARTALFLLSLSFAVLAVTYGLQRGAFEKWPARSR
jgi:molybdate transport system permease protein